MGLFGRGMGMGGCKRCSTCAIHYPPQSAHDVCEVCEEPTSYFSNVEPDEDWEDRVKYAKSKPVVRATRDPHEHRFEQYLRMGFNEGNAQLLASATYGPAGMPLWHEIVRRAMERGCTPDLVLEIFV